VERHDNIELVEFVAGFLAAAERKDTITDFPGYLGKEVALIFGNAEAVNAQILLEGARLQRSLEMTGRSLTLAGSALLTTTLTAGAVPPDADLIVLAEYSMIDEQTDLLRQLGFTRVEVTPTPEATVTSTVTATVPASEISPFVPPLTPTATPTITVPATEGGDEEAVDQARVGSDNVAGSVHEISASVQITPLEPITPTKSITGTITPEVTGTPETPTPTPTTSATPTMRGFKMVSSG
jgi:hypothetical protein